MIPVGLVYEFIVLHFKHAEVSVSHIDEWCLKFRNKKNNELNNESKEKGGESRESS